ncbi:hypothetical protein [Andreprevotia chitinilytica]|uniref:hypothetical protein n=1 Tax=Andreprevotia chitinilytica TaxID=396808 RepID=UPI0012EB1308|nr:hypothetical protein [Andreprevotia chitinilytica]
MNPFLLALLVVGVLAGGFYELRKDEVAHQQVSAINLPVIRRTAPVTPLPSPNDDAFAEALNTPSNTQIDQPSGVRKCVGQGGSVHYQDKPCSTGERQVAMRDSVVNNVAMYHAQPSGSRSPEDLPPVASGLQSMDANTCKQLKDEFLRSANLCGSKLFTSYEQRRLKEVRQRVDGTTCLIWRSPCEPV